MDELQPCFLTWSLEACRQSTLLIAPGREQKCGPSNRELGGSKNMDQVGKH